MLKNELTKRLKRIRDLALKKLREVEKEERLKLEREKMEGERQKEEWL